MPSLIYYNGACIRVKRTITLKQQQPEMLETKK